MLLTSILKSMLFGDRFLRKPVKMETHKLPLKIKTVFAFGAIYFVWGSTYLAIRFAVETIPPFFMMACRSLLAGGILYAWARLRGEERPRPAQWATAAAVGALLFLGGYGTLAWSEQIIPSGVAALIMATTPIWMTLLQALLGNDNPLTGRLIPGLFIGFCGVFLLVDPSELLDGTPVNPIVVLVLLLGTLSWSIGSIYWKKANLPQSSMMASGMNLLSGGGSLFLVSYLSRESITLSSVSLRSLASLLYLVVFGSIITFTAYIWLIRKTSPTRVSTYAYVNPVVAVFVGWFAGGELLSPRILFAALLMVIGVAAIVTQNSTSYSSVKKLKFSETNSLTNLSQGRKPPI